MTEWSIDTVKKYKYIFLKVLKCSAFMICTHAWLVLNKQSNYNDCLYGNVCVIVVCKGFLRVISTSKVISACNQSNYRPNTRSFYRSESLSSCFVIWSYTIRAIWRSPSRKVRANARTRWLRPCHQLRRSAVGERFYFKWLQKRHCY